MRKMNQRTIMIVVALAVLPVTACTTWRPVMTEPTTVVADRRPSSLRLTLRDGSVATIASPLVRGDSIVPAGIGGHGVAAADVELLEVRQLSVGRTIGLVAAGAAAAVAWASVVAGSSSGDGDGSDPLPKGISPSILNGLAWLGRLMR